MTEGPQRMTRHFNAGGCHAGLGIDPQGCCAAPPKRRAWPTGSRPPATGNGSKSPQHVPRSGTSVGAVLCLRLRVTQWQSPGSAVPAPAVGRRCSIHTRWSSGRRGSAWNQSGSRRLRSRRPLTQAAPCLDLFSCRGKISQMMRRRGHRICPCCARLCLRCSPPQVNTLDS